MASFLGGRNAPSVLLAAVAACVLGCAGGDSSNEGDEGCPCYANGTCNGALVCLNDLCVAPAGPDAAAIDAPVSGADGSNDTQDAGRVDAPAVEQVIDAASLDAAIPDDAAPPDAHTGPCNAVAQTGCFPDQKCAVVVDVLDPFEGHVGCVADGTDAVGDPCTEATAVGTADSCAAGGECYNGYCHEICTTVADACADGACQTFVDGAGDPLPTEICLFACDPLAQDCVAENEGCFIATSAVCVVAGDRLPGETCTYANSCVPGNVCVGSPGQCRPFCGPFALGWSETVDDPPALNWPNCCSSECAGVTGFTNPCTGINEVCWPIVNGSGEFVDDNAGFCISDVDITGDGTSISCSCTSNPGAGVDKCTEV